ncbi:MAG: hypothetical protein KF724_04190 [Phycisphaeraceae bacterium]|nr:hypothetical protein [Phycisphaeraceae bacterium]
MRVSSCWSLHAVIGAGILFIASTTDALARQSAGTVAAAAGARAAAASPADARSGTPFVLAVEQRVKLEPPEWDTLELRELEARIVNATSDAWRAELEAQAAVLRERMDRDGACVLLGRSAARGDAGGRPTAVFVPAGMSGWEAERGSTVRVTPSARPWPSLGLGLAAQAFPELRTFGTEARPGFVASAIEIVTRSDTAPGAAGATTESVIRAIPGRDKSPWTRAVASPRTESASLQVEGGPESGPILNGRVPMSITVRNAGVQALPPSEVFFEFMDASGNLIHREFQWVTPQRAAALEARLPALAPGAVATIETPVPPEIAAQARSCRVLILRFLSGVPR